MTVQPSMTHPFISMFVGLALSFYVIIFSRSMFRSPDVYIRRWTTFLPQANWSWKLVRAGGAICLFFGCIISFSAISVIFPVRPGNMLLLSSVAAAAIATACLLPAKLPPSKENLRDTLTGWRRLREADDLIRKRREERQHTVKNRRKS